MFTKKVSFNNVLKDAQQISNGYNKALQQLSTNAGKITVFVENVLTAKNSDKLIQHMQQYLQETQGVEFYDTANAFDVIAKFIAGNDECLEYNVHEVMHVNYSNNT